MYHYESLRSKIFFSKRERAVKELYLPEHILNISVQIHGSLLGKDLFTPESQLVFSKDTVLSDSILL